MKKFGILLLVGALAAGAFELYRSRSDGRESFVVNLEPGPPTPRISLGEAGIDPAAVQLAVDYAGKRRTTALVIGRNGHIVFEKYWGDTTADTQVRTPGFGAIVPLLTGSVMNDRLITSIDDPVSNYLPEYAGTATGRGSIRDHLAKLVQSDAPLPEILALVLERVTKQPFEKLLIERLWKPLGGGDITLWRNDPVTVRKGAVSAGPVGARIEDWMRIGEVLASDGVFQGNQLTPPRFVALMQTPASQGSTIGFDMIVEDRFAAADVAYLWAGRDQRLWVVPSLRLVILRVGEGASESDGWDEAMIPDSIIRGTSGWKPRSAGEAVDPKKFAPH